MPGTESGEASVDGHIDDGAGEKPRHRRQQPAHGIGLLHQFVGEGRDEHAGAERHHTGDYGGGHAHDPCDRRPQHEHAAGS